MAEAEKGAARARRAAEHEHSGAATRDDKRRADTEAAKAHPTLTDTNLRKGHPPGNADWRDKPVDEERDKDIKHGGIEGAARKEHGRP